MRNKANRASKKFEDMKGSNPRLLYFGIEWYLRGFGIQVLAAHALHPSRVFSVLTFHLILILPVV